MFRYKKITLVIAVLTTILWKYYSSNMPKIWAPDRLNPLTTIAVLSLALWKYYNIPVPKDFESPHKFRFFHIVLSTFNIGLQIAKKVKYDYGPDHILYRNLFNQSIHKTAGEDHPDVKAENIIINGVKSRVYTPVSLGDTKNAPILIYFHGGAYFWGNLDAFHEYLNELSVRLNYVIVSVDYRLAPEHPFPAPTDDCYAVTKYVLESKDEFGDTNKVILAGDSAGGNAVACLTQRFKKENSPIMPKIQVLIYPWTQLINPTTVSVDFEANTDRNIKFVSWYFGVTDVDEISPHVASYNHLLLVNKEKREKILSYLDVSWIPEEFKYKERYDGYNIQKILPNENDELNSIFKDTYISKNLSLTFTPAVSPGVAEPEDLIGLPDAYFIISGHDQIRDDGLIYSERLRRAGNNVKVKLYENAHHGVVQNINKKHGYSVARDMLNDLVDYLKKNV